jgi:energy-coupling factor transporter ATP-binding protein EcfA2
MLDFYNIVVVAKKDGTFQLRPDWIVGRSDDLMVRGKGFYAIWDEARGIWSTDIYDVQRLVDEDLEREAARRGLADNGKEYTSAKLSSNNSKLWDEFQRYLRNCGNNFRPLNEKLIFENAPASKKDYSSIRLPYSLEYGNHDAWDSIVGTLYDDEERQKIEWGIGAVVSGQSRFIQKFLVFYGPPASGKSTILNVIQKLFHGYTSLFDARELASNNNAFASAAFKNNPLVGIQHDGDLSRIYDNTKLNSIVSHEDILVNEKFQAQYSIRSSAFLFMGTNIAVRITDAKSGIIRRLIDVTPTRRTIDTQTYYLLMDQIDFELGAIAEHCLSIFKSMGKNFYDAYRPKTMMLQTDVFYNFVDYYFDQFKEEDSITLVKAWALYKEYCSETGIEARLPQYKLREELKNYFVNFDERKNIHGKYLRNIYSGFRHLERIVPFTELPLRPDSVYTLDLCDQPSVFDRQYSGRAAQYAGDNGKPSKKWANVLSTLGDLDSHQLHFVKVPETHIVIDFDLVGESGDKDLDENIRQASILPPTYAEVSQSGKGIHLHYLYDGDVTEVGSVYGVGIEVKTFTGDSSLRRKLTTCNDLNITTISGSWLPKKEKSVISTKSIQSEKGLRDLIDRNLRKEIHPGTKPSVDFIYTILEEAYESGLAYDVLDMRSVILTFAAKSTNQAPACLALVQKMKFIGKSTMPEVGDEEGKIVFFDVEVYPNLLLICWKAQGDQQVSRMINPTDSEVEPLFKMKLVGFNNRRYDNHILYARYLGYSLADLYALSQKIILGGNNRDAFIGEAYNISYTDIYDFSSEKKGLKQFMIDLDIPHVELDLPWDQPVPEKLWPMVEAYCVNDVEATEKVFESRKQDFVARQILSTLSGLSVNHTTQTHAARIIFGKERSPQASFVYTNLGEKFPGYNFDGKESTYRGEITGEGGYVYAEPGTYENVSVLDIASMHPTSIECLNLFGPYTKNFSALKEARLAIKHKEYDTARELFDGKLRQFLGDDKDSEILSYALKIVINIVYGLTSARFDNPFRDRRNKDNIVAKRGALFMIDLKHEVQNRGFSVIHIKTDSIKIPNATQKIIDFIITFGKEYGYDFEEEPKYDWFCLVNDAVYVARSGDKWTAVGAQFQHPYVMKSLFSHEELEFKDFCESRNVVQGHMYLDFSGTGDIKEMVHVGRTGSFVPVMSDGGTLWRVKDDQKYAVASTKGYSWMLREVAATKRENNELEIDMSYFDALKDKALEAIEKSGGLPKDVN